jgi:3-hydroxy-9,10-secoandrosta-1,3,5(10)-triene-9,17-dione monooxygenase reductase component
MDCRVHAMHEAGDHLIFIGEVLELDVQDSGTPLVFHGGGYRLLEPPLGA